MNLDKFIQKFLLKFSYSQKLSVIVFLTFFICIATSLGIWYSCTLLYEDTQLDTETHALQVNVSRITHLLAGYQIEVVREKFNPSPQGKNNLNSIQNEIDNQLDVFIRSLEVFQSQSNALSLQQRTRYHLEKFDGFLKLWNEYKKIVPQEPLERLDHKMDLILESLDLMQAGLRSGYRLYSNADEGTKRLIDANFVSIPRLVSQIPHYYTIINETGTPISPSSSPAANADAYGILLRREDDLLKFNVALEGVSKLIEASLYEDERPIFSKIMTELSESDEAVRKSFQKKTKEDPYQIAVTSLQAYSRAQQMMDGILERLYEAQASTMVTRIYVGYSCVFIAAFFILGTYFTKIVLQPIKELADAANDLAVGLVNVRVPIRFQDEVGEMSQGFNMLAEFLENKLAEVKGISENLLNSVYAISDVAHKLEQNIALQEKELNEVKIHIKEITQVVKEFSLQLNNVYRSISATAGIADVGRKSIAKMEAVMQQMMEASKSIVDTLGLLNVRICSINNVISTVVKIADQINLLALNTAIQANKAGPEGKGFSIIAQKIKEVSGHTAASTLDIEKTVEEIVGQVEETVKELNKFLNQVTLQVNDSTLLGAEFKALIDYLQEETEIFKSVNKDMLKQAESATELQAVLFSLSQTSKKTSVSVEQFRREIQSLRLSTTSLVEKIDSFTHPSYIQQRANQALAIGKDQGAGNV